MVVVGWWSLFGVVSLTVFQFLCPTFFVSESSFWKIVREKCLPSDSNFVPFLFDSSVYCRGLKHAAREHLKKCQEYNV